MTIWSGMTSTCPFDWDAEELTLQSNSMSQCQWFPDCYLPATVSESSSTRMVVA